MCAHGELLWLSCHCCLAIITWWLFRSPVHGNVTDSPVPNLALVGNTSSQGGLQYVVHGLSSGDAAERNSQLVVNLWQRGSHQLGTDVLALQGGKTTLCSSVITLLCCWKMLKFRVKRTETAVGRDERALLDICYISLRGVEALGSQTQQAAPNCAWCY